jgi:hypothetical protein
MEEYDKSKGKNKFIIELQVIDKRIFTTIWTNEHPFLIP